MNVQAASKPSVTIDPHRSERKLGTGLAIAGGVAAAVTLTTLVVPAARHSLHGELTAWMSGAFAASLLATGIGLHAQRLPLTGTVGTPSASRDDAVFAARSIGNDAAVIRTDGGFAPVDFGTGSFTLDGRSDLRLGGDVALDTIIDHQRQWRLTRPDAESEFARFATLDTQGLRSSDWTATGKERYYSND